jgi:hypothetical protein
MAYLLGIFSRALLVNRSAFSPGFTSRSVIPGKPRRGGKSHDPESRTPFMLTGLLALIDSALFTGAALYVSFAEQPARLVLEDWALLAEWKPAYKRGFAM